jgi:hypothetical protein
MKHPILIEIVVIDDRIARSTILMTIVSGAEARKGLLQ